MKRVILSLVLAAAIVVTAGPAHAFSFLDRAYGTPEAGFSARSRAMGGAGAAMGNGTYSLMDNPAAMVLTPGTRAQIEGSLSRASENRFVPLFDTFDSFVDETAIAVNDNGYGGVQGGFVLDRWGKRGILVSVGIFNRYDPRFDYLDELRSQDVGDTLLNNKIITSEGMLRSLSAGVALPLGEGSSLGAAVNYYFGTFTDRRALVRFPTSFYSSGTDTVLERKLDGFSVTIGALAHVDERLDVGASIETAPKLHDDYTLWYNGVEVSPENSNADLTLPLRVQGGLAYRPRNTFETTFAADVVYMPWSELKDKLPADILQSDYGLPATLNDTWQGRFGIEHIFYNNLPARIGFRFGDSYGMTEAQTSAFTFGFGYVIDQMKLDVSGEVSKRVSRQDPVRSRGDLNNQNFGVGASKDRVEDTLVRIHFGVDYAF